MSVEKQDHIKAEDFKVMSDAVYKIQRAAREMTKGGLTRRAVVLLLHHDTGVAQRDVTAVLDGLNRFADMYLTDEYLKLRSKETKK